jgi:peptidoglycan/xylan/chitin deacetylase (PgdA/CDA1 family)
MYHRFVTQQEYNEIDGDERFYSIPIEAFEAHLRRLKQLGYRSLSADEAVAFAQGKGRWKQPIVLITIDDGCRSVVTRAEPLLRKHGFRAVLFVTLDPSAYVFGSSRPDQSRISDDELRTLDPNVIEVQSHGVSHQPMRDLPDEVLADELAQSRAGLEHITGLSVRHLAIPGNWYDARVLRMARQAGYEGVYVSDRDWVRPGSDLSRLPRFNIGGHTTHRAFEKIIGGGLTSRADGSLH